MVQLNVLECINSACARLTLSHPTAGCAVHSRAHNTCMCSSCGRRNCQNLSRCASSQCRSVLVYSCGSKFDSQTWELSRWTVLSSTPASIRSTVGSTSYAFYGHSSVHTVNKLWAGHPGYQGSIPCNDRCSHRILSSVNLRTFSRREVAVAWSWVLASIQCSG
jgi:hypothetical protein